MAEFLPWAGLLVVCICVVLLRLFKPYKRTRHDNWRELVDSNAGELAILLAYIAIAAPGWGRLLAGLFN